MQSSSQIITTNKPTSITSNNNQNLKKNQEQTRDDLGSVDFDKSKVGQRVAEQLTDSGLHAEYRLIGHRAKVKDTIVQSRVDVHLRQLLETASDFLQPQIHF